MPEPIEQTPEEVRQELATLRQTVSEITAKQHKSKTRIGELEIQAVALQDKATKAEAAIHDALVGAPLRRMASTVSEVPELFLNEFAKHYSIASDQDGNITVNTLDGKPAHDRNGKPVEFTPQSLYSLLASDAVVAGGSKDARSKTFATLMKYFGASGAASVTASQRNDGKRVVLGASFGLR
jgi:hypothetical protein